MKTLVYCGAWKGDGLEAVLKDNSFDSVYAFEPNPSLVEILKARFPLVNVMAACVGAKAGKTTFKLHGKNAESSSMYNIAPKFRAELDKAWGPEYFNQTEEIQVQVTTLPIFMSKKKIDVIDLLVLDVQGNDLSVLKTLDKELKAGKIKKFQLEIDNDGNPHYEGSPDNSISSLIEFMKDHPNYRQISGKTAPWGINVNELQSDVVFELIND